MGTWRMGTWRMRCNVDTWEGGRMWTKGRMGKSVHGMGRVRGIEHTMACNVWVAQLAPLHAVFMHNPQRCHAYTTTHLSSCPATATRRPSRSPSPEHCCSASRASSPWLACLAARRLSLRGHGPLLATARMMREEVRPHNLGFRRLHACMQRVGHGLLMHRSTTELLFRGDIPIDTPARLLRIVVNVDDIILLRIPVDLLHREPSNRDLRFCPTLALEELCQKHNPIPANAGLRQWRPARTPSRHPGPAS
jgi:hypothetical protein